MPTLRINVPVRYVIRPRARRVSLRIDAAKREVIVVLPRARDRKRAEDLVRDKASWLEEHLSHWPLPMPFIPGGVILFRGKEFVLAHEIGRGAAHEADNRLIVPCPEAASFSGRTRRALITLARENLTTQAQLHADALGVEFSALSVRDTASRWGSCSAAGRLNFSWRLICTPPEVLDYVCAHEVAHLIEHNHGPRFWALVDGRVGDSKPHKRWMRDNSARLFAVGAEA